VSDEVTRLRRSLVHACAWIEELLGESIEHDEREDLDELRAATGTWDVIEELERDIAMRKRVSAETGERVGALRAAIHELLDHAESAPHYGPTKARIAELRALAWPREGT
jgi:hypothetical protein